MSRKRKKQNKATVDPATQAFYDGVDLLNHNNMFTPLLHQARLLRYKGNSCPESGWAIVVSSGAIHVHHKRRATPQEWAYIIAHCLLHLAFEHFKKIPPEEMDAWNAACDYYINQFLNQLKIGRPPLGMEKQLTLSGRNEMVFFNRFKMMGIPEEARRCSTTDLGGNDMVWREPPQNNRYQPPDWSKLFAQGVMLSVSTAVAKAAHVEVDKNGNLKEMTIAQQARQWFISKYPLLAALATTFTIIEDRDVCRHMNIRVAAVHPELKEIYINPVAALNIYECRFVMAHEIMHVGLRHETRRQGRDAYLWNVACDYAINSWLIEMDIGTAPSLGVLYDPKLKGMSAEAIYDHITTNMRYYRKLATLRGHGLGDMLDGSRPNWWELGKGIDLDEFYRRCLGQGLLYHEADGRGFLPAGLVEEIRALSVPPIPWDVELARWFDVHFPPREKRRSYARPSRRQSATPNIPRPSWYLADVDEQNRTFGVILDTSGSMNRKLLAQALGAIASYSMARDINFVRVVFCDATYYDAGYMPPEAIADKVKVKGRGGTILQPAISFLHKTEDFPKNGPLLIITDGYCDRLSIPATHEHAYLLPKGHRLPFVPKGEVFYVE